MPEDVEFYKDVALAAVKRDGVAFPLVKAPFCADRDIAIQAVKDINTVFQHMPQFHNDKEVLLNALNSKRSFGSILQFASQDLLKDEDIAYAALGQNALMAFQYFPKHLQNDAKIINFILNSENPYADILSKELLKQAQKFGITGDRKTIAEGLAAKKCVQAPRNWMICNPSIDCEDSFIGDNKDFLSLLCNTLNDLDSSARTPLTETEDTLNNSANVELGGDSPFNIDNV